MGQFNFLLRLIRKSGPDSRRLLWASMAAGILQGLLLYVISLAIEELGQHGALSLRSFLLFILSLLGLYKSLDASMMISSRVGRDLVTGLEMRITDKLSRTSYTHFTTLEQSRIYDAITGNKDIINESAIMLPIFISSCAMLFCSLLFCAYVSLAGLAGVLLAMGLGALIFFLSDKRFVAALMAYRKSAEAFQATLKDVILGFTELKMNEQRRTALFADVIGPLERKALEGRTHTDRYRVQNTVMYGLLVYFPVGTLLFILPQTGLATLEQCIKVVAITMFSTMPLIGLLSFMPIAARAAFIVQGLEEFEHSLEQALDAAPTTEAAPLPPDFKEITITDAEYQYPAQNGTNGSFALKIDDFKLKRGELVIIRGGNGSGKTTFMRLVAGLVPLMRGGILVDGLPMTDMGEANYRALFSVLFPNFHLFSGLYGIKADAARVASLLRYMALDSKISLDATGRFSTLALSSGQRKRLGLACAILEDRPILLLDEVAADFDHHFREKFYLELLPELKREGRTLLIISHDDRYFKVADRVLTLQYGEFIAPAVEPTSPLAGGKG